MIQKVSVREKLSMFEELWSPKIVAELNGQQVKLAKLKGEFEWHFHEREDELFLVVSGVLRILLRDGEIALEEGELCVIPRGVEHKPIADREAHVMFFEPASTVNTGNVRDERTVEEVERI